MCTCVHVYVPMSGFYLGQIFEGEIEGRVGLMGCLRPKGVGAEGGRAPPPAQSAESLSISSYQCSL